MSKELDDFRIKSAIKKFKSGKGEFYAEDFYIAGDLFREGDRGYPKDSSKAMFSYKRAAQTAMASCGKCFNFYDLETDDSVRLIKTLQEREIGMSPAEINKTRNAEDYFIVGLALEMGCAEVGVCSNFDLAMKHYAKSAYMFMKSPEYSTERERLSREYLATRNLMKIESVAAKKPLDVEVGIAVVEVEPNIAATNTNEFYLESSDEEGVDIEKIDLNLDISAVATLPTNILLESPRYLTSTGGQFTPPRHPSSTGETFTPPRRHSALKSSSGELDAVSSRDRDSARSANKPLRSFIFKELTQPAGVDDVRSHK